MNIEEDIKNLKTYIELVIEKNYCDCNELNTICYGKYGDGSKNVAKSIENVLTAYEKEKEKNKELSEHADNLLGEKEYYQDCYDGITFKINNLISQIESAIDFMKTDKSKIKVDMYQQKEEDLKLEVVYLKKLLKEE